METTRRKSKAIPPAASLFDRVRDGDRSAFQERIRNFASEVAKRHRHGRGDLNEMLVALRGWHGSWAVCAPSPVPPLDDESVSLAIAAYEVKTGSRRRNSAA